MKNNGGPAFPIHPGVSLSSYAGMSLRDYFAAKAMQGMCSDRERNPVGNYAEITSKNAYEIADAMIEARDEN